MICRLAFWEDCSGGELVRGGVWYSGRQSVLNGKERRLVMWLKCRSKLWRIQSFLFQRMLQSVFLMMEGGDGGITISEPKPMISVRLPVFDSESGTRRNRIWDVIRPNLGRDTTASGTWHDRIWDVTQTNQGRRSLASLVDGLSGRWQCRYGGWKCVQFPVASWRQWQTGVFFASWNRVENRKIQGSQKINSILFGVIGKIL